MRGLPPETGAFRPLVDFLGPVGFGGAEGIDVFGGFEVDGPVGVLVGGVALEDFGFAVLVSDVLVVVVVLAGFGVFGAVPDDLEVPIATEAGIGAGVPLVAFLGEDFGPEWALDGIVLAAGVGAFHAHGFDAVGVAAGEHGGAGGHAPGAVIGGEEGSSGPVLEEEFQAELELAAGGLSSAEFAEFGVVVVAG